MTAPGGTQPQQPQKSSAMKRYGPLIGIAVVVAVVVVIVVVAGRGSSDNTASSGGTSPGGGSAGAADVPITYAQAKAQGKEKDYTWVDNCDFETGRIKMPSVYAPPCVPKLSGDNGGATAPGVTGDEVTVVAYVPPQNGDVLAVLGGSTDPPEKTEATAQAYAKMIEDLYETYGRKINYVRYEAKGAAQDATAAQADAVTVAETYHPFMSIGGPALTPAYAEELTRRNIICIACGAALPDEFFQEHAPYMWANGMTPEQFLQPFSEYISKRVLGRKAEFAGDESMRDKERVFGTVNFEQDPPVFGNIQKVIEKCGSQSGYKAAASESYIFDIGKMPERATTIIAKMKEAGVTSVIFLGDPIMPIYLTQAATAQGYFPEWIISGTALTDTNVLGRYYDPQQWRHAFGVSYLGAKTDRDQQEPWRLHQWYYNGAEPVASNTSGLIYAPIAQALLGIHMAGPKLTPETYKAGMFNYPESGGGIINAHVSYGDHGYFKTTDIETCKADQPLIDYASGDDMTEIWWDGDATGPDEQNKTDKPGLYRFANNGKRYLPGQQPTTDTDAFKKENTFTNVTDIPQSDQPPTYPPQTNSLPPVP